METPGRDRFPHPPRGRVRDGQGAGGLLVQGVRGHRRGRRRAEPHRGGRDEASKKTSPAKAGQPLRGWVFQDGNLRRLAVDINPRSTSFSVQVTLNLQFTILHVNILQMRDICPAQVCLRRGVEVCRFVDHDRGQACCQICCGQVWRHRRL